MNHDVPARIMQRLVQCELPSLIKHDNNQQRDKGQRQIWLQALGNLFPVSLKVQKYMINEIQGNYLFNFHHLSKERERFFSQLVSNI